MIEHSINSQYEFIQGYYLEDLSICDELVEFHHNAADKSPGKVGSMRVDPAEKDSIDCSLVESATAEKYLDQLFECGLKYMEKYPYAGPSQGNAPWSLTSYINIQQYRPGGGFFNWHCERTGSQMPGASRHLVFMTYLNDVTDAGETEFFHQKLKVKPEKGLTLIWPVDWTFTHRGIPSPTQEKFITTGWFNYI